MENQIPKTGNRKPARRNNKQVTPTTEAGNPVMFVTIEEHNEKINEKLSQLISLENAFRGCERKITNLESAVKDLKGSNNNLRLSFSRIPTWIKKLFNAA